MFSHTYIIILKQIPADSKRFLGPIQVTQNLPVHPVRGTHLYTCVWRQALWRLIRCLALERNVMTPARAQTWTTQTTVQKFRPQHFPVLVTLTSYVNKESASKRSINQNNIISLVVFQLEKLFESMCCAKDCRNGWSSPNAFQRTYKGFWRSPRFPKITWRFLKIVRIVNTFWNFSNDIWKRKEAAPCLSDQLI